jgi:hypothetical protein
LDWRQRHFPIQIAVACVAIICSVVTHGDAQVGKFDSQAAIRYAKFIQAAEKADNTSASPPFGYQFIGTIYAQRPNDFQPSPEFLPIDYVAISTSPPMDALVIFGDGNSDATFLWAQNGKFLFTPLQEVPGGGLVESNIADSYRSAYIGTVNRVKVADAIQELVQQKQIKTIHIAGHEWGAGLATIQAVDLASNHGLQNLDVYTFSSPRVGDSVFGKTYGQRVPSSWRISNRLDIISKTPPPPAYVHIGQFHDLIPPAGVRFSPKCEASLQPYLQLLDPKESLDTACILEHPLVNPPPVKPSEGLFLRFIREGWALAVRFWPATALASAIGACATALAALFLLAYRKGTTVISRNWLISKAAKPLMAVPGLGRDLLFLGYANRLKENTVVVNVVSDYFGLPAQGVSGEVIPPDANGDTLHNLIAGFIGARRPVIVIGSGGLAKARCSRG